MSVQCEVEDKLATLRQGDEELIDYNVKADQERARFKGKLSAMRNSLRHQGDTSPCPHKKLGLHEMITSWTGEPSGPTVDAFVRSIEIAAATGHWSEQNKKNGMLAEDDGGSSGLLRRPSGALENLCDNREFLGGVEEEIR